MTDYPGTPEGVVEARFVWLSQGNFQAIYRSYHSQANFREHFPQESEYLVFAAEQQLAQITLLELLIVDRSVRGNLAKVLTRQAYRVDGAVHHYLEVTTLRLQDDLWQVLFARRVACDPDLREDAIDWESVEKHPEAIVY